MSTVSRVSVPGPQPGSAATPAIAGGIALARLLKSCPQLQSFLVTHSRDATLGQYAMLQDAQAVLFAIGQHLKAGESTRRYHNSSEKALGAVQRLLVATCDAATARCADPLAPPPPLLPPHMGQLFAVAHVGEGGEVRIQPPPPSIFTNTVWHSVAVGLRGHVQSCSPSPSPSPSRSPSTSRSPSPSAIPAVACDACSGPSGEQVGTAVGVGSSVRTLPPAVGTVCLAAPHVPASPCSAPLLPHPHLDVVVKVVYGTPHGTRLAFRSGTAWEAAAVGDNPLVFCLPEAGPEVTHSRAAATRPRAPPACVRLPSQCFGSLQHAPTDAARALLLSSGLGDDIAGVASLFTFVLTHHDAYPTLVSLLLRASASRCRGAFCRGCTQAHRTGETTPPAPQVLGLHMDGEGVACAPSHPGAVPVPALSTGSTLADGLLCTVLDEAQVLALREVRILGPDERVHGPLPPFTYERLLQFLWHWDAMCAALMTFLQVRMRVMPSSYMLSEVEKLYAKTLAAFCAHHSREGDFATWFAVRDYLSLTARFSAPAPAPAPAPSHPLCRRPSAPSEPAPTLFAHPHCSPRPPALLPCEDTPAFEETLAAGVDAMCVCE